VSKSRIYYNSACPVCNAGIAAERRRMEACNVDAEWIDIHRNPGRLEEIGASVLDAGGLRARQRMHVHHQRIVHAVELDRLPERRVDDARAAEDRGRMAADAIEAIEGPRFGIRRHDEHGPD